MILVDTGAWLALADKGDAYHARCVAFFRSNCEPLMTTYPVLVECVHLMFRRIGVTNPGYAVNLASLWPSASKALTCSASRRSWM
jgi:predicted nucleic acid-binding protein